MTAAMLGVLAFAVPSGRQGSVWLWLCMASAALALGLAVGQSRLGRKRTDTAPAASADALSVLPGGWRLVLPVLRRLSWCAQPWLGWQARQRLTWLLQEAGLNPALDAVLLRTAQCLLGTLLAMAAGLGVWHLLHADGGSGPAAKHLGLIWLTLPAGLLAGWHAPRLSLAARVRERRRRMAADLPLALEMLALCLAGGQHFNGALQQMTRHAPRGVLQQEFALAWAEIMQGRPRVEAIRILAQRTGLPAMRRFAAALAQADSLGMALGPLLRAQARQLQEERIQQAEKQAMEAPVKMLLPLMTCIFPCTFLVLAYPVMHYLQEGVAG